MPRILKGDIKRRNSHNWGEYFDGKRRVFEGGKDFKNRHTFTSSVHQAAKRLGYAVTTKSEGKNIEVQGLGKKKAAKAKTARAPRKSAKAKTAAPAKRARKAKVLNGVSQVAEAA